MMANSIGKNLLFSIKRHPERQFFTLTSFWFVGMVLLGFGRTFYFKNYTPPLAPYLQLHGLIFSSWILLYCFQNVMIASLQIRKHKLAGFFGIVLISAVFVSSYYTILYKTYTGNKSLLEALFNLSQIALGVGTVFLSILLRRNTYYHKRLMLASLVFLTLAAVQRASGNLGFGPNGPLVDALYLMPLIALVLFELAYYGRLKFASLLLFLFAFTYSKLRIYRLLDNDFGQEIVNFLIDLFVIK
ncbi:hypothetical protein SAMN05444394_0518 [Algoriphagus halophilus]|uniref:Uncharacterized protein n=2 Tax=Algoriphagus halophilus TaxID=226505 RepID=A0A1N6D9D7_9BACT|nr:hypothetical protein SAMN05444394_0518 [Algoriphagus halophilus]